MLYWPHKNTEGAFCATSLRLWLYYVRKIELQLCFSTKQAHVIVPNLHSVLAAKKREIAIEKKNKKRKRRNIKEKQLREGGIIPMFLTFLL